MVKTNSERGFYELIIPDVQQEDAGNYKCIASNIHGEAECESNVTVVGECLFSTLKHDIITRTSLPHRTRVAVTC